MDRNCSTVMMANNSSSSKTENNSSPALSSTAVEVEILPEKSADAYSKASSSNGSSSNSGVQRKMMTNLPKRPPALIEYSDLSYTVREKSGKWFGGVVGQSKKILHGESEFEAEFELSLS